jgi:succinate dehydrogenase / fumarate reductase, membrane anchor subunit
LACIEPEHYAMTLSSHTKSAHALHDWLAQRITAGVMAAFTLIVLAQVIFNKGTMGYEKWAGIFAPHWMKLLSLVVILALAYHVWLGMREIYMDYVKPVSLRLSLQVFTIVWLVGCVGWAIQVLWRI